MGNLMSCVLICGAVEVVHVVHSDGHVERLIRPLKSSTTDDHHQQHEQVLKKQSSSSASSLPQADLMRCLTTLGRTSSDSDAFSHAAGSSYLLLPIRNADDHSSSATSGDVFKYKRFSSFQFYKSALLSPSHTLKPRSAPSKSLTAPPKKDKVSQDHGSKKKVYMKDSSHQQHDDRKQLLRESQPFKVRQEGGVTKLVVSKKYLAQLLSESNMKKATSASTSSPGGTMSKCSSKQDCYSKQDANSHNGGAKGPNPPVNKTSGQPSSSSSSGSSRVGRPSIWRPALESISETVLIAR